MTDTDERPRRFYKDVDVVTADGGFAVTLDGRALKTPAKKPFVTPTRAIADLVAEEWARQDERVDAADMLATRLVNVALDRAPAHRDAIADEVARYAATDLVCHLEGADAALRARQDAAWAGVRAWADEALGVRLITVEGVIATPQPQASLDAARAAALAFDDVRLVALAHATAVLGSSVLALALAHGALDAAAAFTASRVDEDHQAERWGVDAEAADRAAALAQEVRVVERLLRAAG